MKGLIALDIDGTITASHQLLSQNVTNYFIHLNSLGWKFVFLTGRTFSWGYRTLQLLPFPYYFAVQNGAILLQLPDKKIIFKKYIDSSLFSLMDQICQNEESDYVLYTGIEENDVCFYRPKRFSERMLQYLQIRKAALEEDWIPIHSFEKFKGKGIASFKCFGILEAAQRISKKISIETNLYSPYIRDPFNSEYYVIQCTNSEITKGRTLNYIRESLCSSGPIIAAGDDYNDHSMLLEADCKIVMATAPQEILNIADIIAPPASEEGIIVGLEEAIKKME